PHRFIGRSELLDFVTVQGLESLPDDRDHAAHGQVNLALAVRDGKQRTAAFQAGSASADDFVSVTSSRLRHRLAGVHGEAPETRQPPRGMSSRPPVLRSFRASRVRVLAWPLPVVFLVILASSAAPAGSAPALAKFRCNRVASPAGSDSARGTLRSPYRT